MSSARHLTCFWETLKNSILLLKSKRFHQVAITALFKYLLSAFTCFDNILTYSFVRKQKEQPCFYVHNTFQMVGVYDADSSENSCGQEKQTTLRTEQ